MTQRLLLAKRPFSILLISGLLILAACAPSTLSPTASPTNIPTPTSTPTTQPPTPTPAPPPTATPTTEAETGTATEETAVLDAQLTYVQGDSLYWQQIESSSDPQLLSEERGETFWSPDGQKYIYTQIITASVERNLHLVVRGDEQSILPIPDFPWRPISWSPDSSQIVYTVNSGLYWEDNPDTMLGNGFWHEVWTAAISADGRFESPVLVGQFKSPGVGCGGGGESWSDRLYDQHGGFALGYQAAGRLEWMADDTLIYSLNCDFFTGYGRFDMTTGEMLEPIEGELRGLVTNKARTRWFAITGHNRRFDEHPTHNQLVTGVPSETGYTMLETAVPVELVTVGQQSGRLYYTSRERIEKHDLSSQVGYTLGTYYNFYHTQLYSLNPDGSDEQLHWEAEDHSFIRMSELPDGSLLFVRIPNDRELLAAVEAGTPEEEWPQFAPQPDILHQTEPLAEPVLWQANTGWLSSWLP